MDARREALAEAIRRSRLLSEDRRERLLKVLPDVDDAHCAELDKLLKSEERMVAEAAGRSMRSALERGDEAAASALGEAVNDATRSLAGGRETAERGEEQTQVNSMFDAS